MAPESGYKMNTMIERLTKLFPKIPGAYLVGGSVRDHLLGKKPVDYAR